VVPPFFRKQKTDADVPVFIPTYRLKTPPTLLPIKGRN